MSETESRPPIPTHASKGRIHTFAGELAEQFGFQPGDALEPLVTKLGGRIIYHNPIAKALDAAPESIRVINPQSFSIFIPSTTSLERDRFTVAHELGHFFLHYPMVTQRYPGSCMVATRWVDETDREQRRAEWEANWFAAAFLMPEAAFKNCYSQLDGNFTAIAEKFAVSVSAARVRAGSLNLG